MLRSARPDDHDAIVALTDAAFAGSEEALTREALRLADEAAEPFVLIVGHPTYYPRFGFEPALPLGLEPPRDFGAAWMAVKLTAYAPSIRGRVVFPPAFG